MQEAERARREHNAQAEERAWRLFVLIPRLLLHRAPGCNWLPKDTFVERFNRFADGSWSALLAEEKALPLRSKNTDSQRATRAEALVGM